jgi:hypothetical protein
MNPDGTLSLEEGKTGRDGGGGDAYTKYCLDNILYID